MELRLPLEMSPGREAACRAVFGTRLHAGIYALRHGVRSILLTVDLRMNSMAGCLPNNCLPRAEVEPELERKIQGEFATECLIDWDAVARWKGQFT